MLYGEKIKNYKVTFVNGEIICYGAVSKRELKLYLKHLQARTPKRIRRSFNGD